MLALIIPRDSSHKNTVRPACACARDRRGDVSERGLDVWTLPAELAVVLCRVWHDKLSGHN